MNNLSSEQLFITDAAKALLENQEQSPFFNLSQYQLWDITSIDGLQLVKVLVGEVGTQITLFESIDFIFTGYQYSVLRLGEEHFRLGLYGELGTYGGLNFQETLTQAMTGLQVSVRKCNEISAGNITTSARSMRLTAYCAIALPQSSGLNILSKTAIVEPPYRLEEMPLNRAVAAKIEDIPVLIWRHQLLSQRVFELHSPVGDVEAIKVKLINIDRSPHKSGKLLE